MANEYHSRVAHEELQQHELRKPLLRKMKRHYGRPVVSFFTSHLHPVNIEDSDVDALENLLLHLDLSDGLMLYIDSPGGSPLAAERIIKMCRSYSGTGEFWAFVAGKAKSAATMICLGASKIIMSETAELGPVDPQFIVREGNQNRFSRLIIW